jgi:hypothetical protein
MRSNVSAGSNSTAPPVDVAPAEPLEDVPLDEAVVVGLEDVAVEEVSGSKPEVESAVELTSTEVEACVAWVLAAPPVDPSVDASALQPSSSNPPSPHRTPCTARGYRVAQPELDDDDAPEVEEVASPVELIVGSVSVSVSVVASVSVSVSVSVS